MQNNSTNKKVVNVHSAAVHIENKVSLISRQSWFYLLYKAVPYLNKQNIFSVSLMELKRAIGYKGNNNEHLKQMLEELVSTTIKWNIFEKVEGEIWGVSGLLSHCEIVSGSGLCTYSFSPGLQQRFLNPSMYIKLNLLISQKFSSKHALALYCLALDYLDIKRNYSEKNFTIPELRKFLGLNDDEYGRVVDLHKHVLKRAEAEINKTSDINVEILPIREAKQKITGFKFIMSIKPAQLGFYNNTPQLKEPSKKNKQKNEDKVPGEIKIKNEKLAGFLFKHQISLEYIKPRLNELSERLDKVKLDDYLMFLADYSNSEIEKGKQIKSLSGFYINLIKDDIQLQNYLFFIENENKKNKEIDKKIKTIYEQKLKLEHSSQSMRIFITFLENILETQLPIFSQIIEEISDANPFIRDTVINLARKYPEDSNRQLIRNSIILSQLFDKSERFNFEKPFFDEWKTDFMNNPDNKEKIERLMTEATKEAKQLV